MAAILFVDDDSDFTLAVQPLLRTEGHEVAVASSVAEASKALQENRFDLMFIDLFLPDGSGLELVRDEGPNAVVITGHPCMDSAIRAVRGKVVDYLVKPVDKAQLTRSIEAAIAGKGRVSDSGDGAAEAPALPSGMLGESAEMQSLRSIIEDYGSTDITVLITGESGTGKELVAQALHKVQRSDQPFVALNCGAIAAELVSSELFGHEKGSFTGATARRAGVFERAAAGTVFLDEIGELPLAQQAALLRVLETRKIQRVGGVEEIAVACRVLAATNRDLTKDVAEGRFREDLYYRLNILAIHVPPLRDRAGDVELLAGHFLAQFAQEHGTPPSFSSEVLAILAAHHWPGNIRELRNIVLREAIRNRGREQISSLSTDLGSPAGVPLETDALQAGMSIRELERNLIQKTLEHFDGNRKLTADALGVSVKTLYNRLREYEESAD